MRQSSVAISQEPESANSAMAAELGQLSIPAFMPQCRPAREWRSRGPLQSDDATPLYTHPCTYQSIDAGSDALQPSVAGKFC